MATQDQINDLTALYAGYFDRAPDPAGLQFWIDQIDGGRPFNTIAADFAASPEATALYPFLVTPAVSTSSAFITAIYANLFNRVPDAAGLEFWTGVLASGDVSVADMIEAIINGAVDDPVANTFDKATLDNKIEVGLDFAEKTGNTPGFVYDAAAAAAAVEVLDGVTNDPATVDAGKLEVDEFLNPTNETFTLTTATDAGAAFVGGDASSVFNAALDLGIDGLVGVQTLQGSDVLDGGEGVDTLNVELNGTGATANPTISNIEVYNMTSFAGILGGSGSLDLSRATGYEQLWNRESRVDLEVFNVGEQAIIGMDGVRGGTNYTVEYEADLVVAEQVVVAQSVGTSATGAATLNLNGTDINSLELNASASRLNVETNAGVFGTLTLNVEGGNTIALGQNVDTVTNLVIAGEGALSLSGADLFPVLESLDATGYNDGLLLDVSGSAVLESVLTGEGDDFITVGAGSVNGGLAVDLGLGTNVLGVADVTDEGDINGLDFTGGVENAQTLALVDQIFLGGDATLDLAGFDDQLATVSVADFDADGFDLTILTAPAVLEITTAEEFEMGGGLFTIDGAVNLTMTSTGTDTDSDIRLDGGVNSETLQTLSIEAADDAALELFGGIDALTTVNVVALGDDADVDMTDVGALGDAAEYAALTTVNVTAANDATLTMTGRAGVVFVAGVNQVEQFTVDVANAGLQTGDVIFTSGDLAGGFIATNYSENGGFGNPTRDNGAARDIAADLNASADLNATSPSIFGFPAGNTVTVEWATAGAKEQLNVLSAVATSGSISSPGLGMTTLVTAGADEIAQVDGEGFEAVETITVDAQDGDADVDLTDVYGAFTLEVTATDNADVDLFNTNATSVTVTAGIDLGDTATVTVDGNTVGNANLVDLTVAGDMANVTLSDDLASFTTLDVSGVVTNLVVDTSGAEFVVASGQFISYLIGATSDGVDLTVDVDFTGNDAREVYDFGSGDIGDVRITDFTFGADPAAGDRLDLSDFAANAGQLIFANVAGDLVITDLAGGLGDFDGSITIVGAGAAAADVSSFNIIFG